jgi:RNA polymerase sigma-70 factor (ECF subfamily)
MLTKNNQINLENDLVSAFRNGSVAAFEELVTLHEERVFNLALRITRNQEDAEEVLQDVFSTVYKKIASFEGKSAFSSWVYRITVNTAYMLLRKKRQTPTIALEDLSANVRQQEVEFDHNYDTRGDNDCVTSELRSVLSAAVARIPEEYRQVFILRDIDGMSNQEVSEVLQLSIPAVKSRLHRARLMLRKKLQAYYDDFTGKRMLTNFNSSQLVA